MNYVMFILDPLELIRNCYIPDSLVYAMKYQPDIKFYLRLSKNLKKNKKNMPIK